MKFRFGNGDRPLDGFTIKRGVGVGGFGEVYFATNDAGKEVALKQIQRNLDVEVRGVRQCMNLKHPNLISLYDIQFDADSQGWIVMEYVSGQSLREALDAHPDGLPPEELRRWFGQISAAVAYLHDHGIVHRDLKPANIFQDEGIVKIGDYGLSKFISCSRRGGQTESVGTFHYMAPEIGKGEYGKEIDIYALGVMLYELATGLVPFDGESSQEIIMKHLTADPDLTVLPQPMRNIVAQALAKNPRHRFSDVRDMARPLGIEVDDCYLPVKTTAAVPPVVQRPAGHNTDPFAATQAGQSSAVDNTPPQHPPEARPQPAAAQQHGARQHTHHAADFVTTARYEEPIARNIQAGWRGINRWWSESSMKNGVKTILLVLLVILCASNAPAIAGLVALALILYVPYFAIWWLVRTPKAAPRAHGRHAPPVRHPLRPNSPVAHAAPQARPIATPAPAAPAAPRKPKRNTLSLRQWRVARRAQLAQQARGSVWNEVTGSWLGSAMVIGVVAALVTVFQIGNGEATQPVLAGVAWASLVALAIAWTSIGLGRRWQKEDGDGAIRCFVQLTFGLAIGLFAFGLSEFLMVSWNGLPGTDTSNLDLPVRHWRGFFSAKEPMLPAFLAYFPLMMGIIRWWKQADPLRSSRFSFVSVIWVVIAASLVHILIPFPQTWAALAAGMASVAIQMSSPWVNPTERFALTNQQLAA